MEIKTTELTGSALDWALNAITLTILLHYYWATDDYKPSSFIAPEFSQSERQGLASLLNNKLIEDSKSNTHYQISDKGRCHIRSLLDAPLPIMSWKSPIGEPNG